MGKIAYARLPISGYLIYHLLGTDCGLLRAANVSRTQLSMSMVSIDDTQFLIQICEMLLNLELKGASQVWRKRSHNLQTVTYCMQFWTRAAIQRNMSASMSHPCERQKGDLFSITYQSQKI